MNRTLMSTENIPKELKSLPQWVVWKYVVKNGEKTKVPCDAKTGQFASVNNPNTWSIFQKAVLLYKNRLEFAGIGFVMTGNEGIVGIDVDGVIDTDLINHFNSYAEKTPSGKGCRIFIKASIALKNNRKNNIELYNTLRFFTVTGDVLNQASIEDRNEDFYSFYKELFKEEKPAQLFSSAKSTTKKVEITQDDEVLLKNIFAHDKYGSDHEMRFNGIIPRCDFSRVTEKNGTQRLVADDSRSRYALVKAFYRWTDGDFERIMRLMLKSNLYTEKWDEMRGSLTFIEYDVRNIIEKYFGVIYE